MSAVNKKWNIPRICIRWGYTQGPRLSYWWVDILMLHTTTWKLLPGMAGEGFTCSDTCQWAWFGYLILNANHESFVLNRIFFKENNDVLLKCKGWNSLALFVRLHLCICLLVILAPLHITRKIDVWLQKCAMAGRQSEDVHRTVICPCWTIWYGIRTSKRVSNEQRQAGQYNNVTCEIVCWIILVC